LGCSATALAGMGFIDYDGKTARSVIVSDLI
jgi:hypothetical protein